MAATNYTPIQLYYSTTASAAPTAGNLTSGELAINITDGKLYYKDNGGAVQVIATKGAGTIGGSTTQIQYNNAGALAGNAAMTFNSGTNVTTLTTLNLTNALGATYGGTAQSAYTQGDVLYASATNTLSKLGIGTVNYILTSTGSVPQWVAPTSITVNTATNLAGGAGGSVPYQSAADTTTFLAIGAANRVMTSSGTVPQWVTALTGLTGVSSSSITNTSLTSTRLVYSSTAGLQADSANLTFDGTTLSATGFSTTGLSTLVKTVKIGDSNFSGTAVFAAATPAKLYIGTGTVTDTTSAIGATNAVGAVSSLAITPIAASNTSVTYTNASTLYIAGAPSAGTNVTITNPYSLYVNAGSAYFGGGIVNSGLTAGRVVYTTTGGLETDSANFVFDGTNVGIGTSSPTTKLEVSGGASAGLMTVSTTSAGAGSAIKLIGSTSAYKNWQISNSYAAVNGALEFTPSTANGGTTFSTPAMLIDSSGNVGIGTTSPAFPLDLGGPSANIRVAPSTATNNALTRYVNTGGTGYVGLDGSAGGLTSAYALNIYHTGAYPIVFSNSGTERMRIDSSGNLLLGRTGQINQERFGYTTTTDVGAISNRASTTAYYPWIFASNGTTVGYIYSTSTATIFSTTSDYRLKTVIGAVTDSGTRIDALEPIEYTWNSNGQRTRGFLAHKFQEVYADSVTGTKDEIDADGKPVYQGMQAGTAEVIADLVAEIQSLRKRLAALER